MINLNPNFIAVQALPSIVSEPSTVLFTVHKLEVRVHSKEIGVWILFTIGCFCRCGATALCAQVCVFAEGHWPLKKMKLEPGAAPVSAVPFAGFDEDW